MSRGEYDEVSSFNCRVIEKEDGKVHLQYGNKQSPYNYFWIDDKGYHVGQRLEIVVYLEDE